MAIEEGLEAMTRGEHAVVSCAREAAVAPVNSLVPSPPGTSDRVEFELRLESMIQVRAGRFVCPGPRLGMPPETWWRHYFAGLLLDGRCHHGVEDCRRRVLHSEVHTSNCDGTTAHESRGYRGPSKCGVCRCGT